MSYAFLYKKVGGVKLIIFQNASINITKLFEIICHIILKKAKGVF